MEMLLERFTEAVQVKKRHYILVLTSMLPVNQTHPGINSFGGCIILVKCQQLRKQKLSFDKMVGKSVCTCL